jgi:hypothetical protein
VFYEVLCARTRWGKPGESIGFGPGLSGVCHLSESGTELLALYKWNQDLFDIVRHALRSRLSSFPRGGVQVADHIPE